MGSRRRVYFLADEKHSRCLTEQVYLPTIVSGRVLWHLGYTKEASAAALTQSYGEFQRAAVQHEPSYRVRGVLTDGFDSTTKSMRTLFPGARLFVGEAATRRQAVEGVNLDEELVNLTTYQQAYNASARMIQATSELLDVLINLV